MSNKQALRDLQTRLADRLQSAQGQSVSVAWLAVRLGEAHYLLPLSQSGEIFPLPSITQVPYTQAWFCGVANLRGGLYAVVDLLALMGDAAVRSEQAWAQVRLVTLNAESGLNCALVLDGLMGLRRQEAFTGVEPAPDGSPAWFGHRLIDTYGQVWQEIDLYALSQTTAFLSIGA
ncbi:chemotaxis protein CheW [Rhodoferax sp. U11-2br]|uniref:chemotaxis protein CheW n=1 Tax=Rhodoferax sp. U11-2br TaxID=2838878 RepID=UPI001BEA2BE2|nr:chemotaxis protein CheW [Rhodoferax sp. U11-2br]MBT3066921.1 chemotaxis protein CheW [Rhodoferax sp. U11-2br]